MTVERDEDHKRNEKDDDGHPTEIYLMPDRWPAREVTDTLGLKGAVKLGLPELHSEDVDAGKRGDQGDEPGCTNKAVGRPRD
jgi:hypothetical protein